LKQRNRIYKTKKEKNRMKKLFILLTIVMLSCGSVFASGASESSAKEDGGLQELNIAYMPNYASVSQVIAGMNAGYFEEQGIKVNLVEFSDGPTEIAAMDSGSIDLAYIGPGAHKLSINGKVKIFALSQVGDSDAVIGLKSHGINTLADLKGKKVGFASGTSSEAILRFSLDSVGLTMDDIMGLEMDASGIVSAMTSGALDACAAWSPNTNIIIDEMGGDAWKMSSNNDFLDKTASIASWIVTNKYATANHDTLVRFSKALLKAQDYRAANIEQTCKWVATQLGSDYDLIYQQRFDAVWPTSAKMSADLNDGTIEKLYEIQKKGFGAAVNQDAKVSDYVLFDVMKEAEK
jgi:NitT/TauT family transport system substrate-binding protein